MSKPSHDDDDVKLGTLLCPTAKLLVFTMDCNSSSHQPTAGALLVAADSGTVLHANPAARSLLQVVPPCDGAKILDLLQFSTGAGDDSTTTASPPRILSSWEEVLQTAEPLQGVALLKQQQLDEEATSPSPPPPPPSLSVTVTRLGGCTCCEREYVCLSVAAAAAASDPRQLLSSSESFSSSACLRDAVNVAFDPMFTLSETGTIEMTNQAAVDLFGYEYDEFIGRNISMVCGGDHASRHEQYMKNYLNTGVAKVIGKQRVVLARRKDGSELPVELGVKEFWEAGRRYFCGFVKDVSAQLKHEAELEERERLLQSLIDSSFEPMFEIDEKGCIRVVNEAATHMFGWSRKEFIGSNISMICGGDHGPKHDQYMRRYLSTGEKRVIGRKRQVQAKRKDGSEFDIELGVQEVVLSDNRRAFCGYVRDLTQQRKDKRALRKNAQLIHGKFFGKTEENEVAP